MKLVDIDRLYQKAQRFNVSIQQRRETVERIKENHERKLLETKTALLQEQRIPKRKAQDSQRENNNKQLATTNRTTNRTITKTYKFEKNPTIGDTDKMMFEKKFKNYLNHREQFREKAKKRRQNIVKERKAKAQLQPGEDYYNEQEVLSNADSDYQYADAEDMFAAYQQIATGKRHKKGGVKLFHSEKIQFALRLSEFQMLLQVEQSDSHVSKDLLLNYLFDEPCIMMLYSINPYSLGDEISDWETNEPDMLSFEQFSNFLLQDRSPTYFEYSKQNLQEARKIGRGLKCAPIVGKWIAEEGIYQWLIDQVFKSVDLFGREEVEREVLAKKLMKEAQRKRLLDYQVIEVVNIGKNISLRRLIYEIQHQERDRQLWSLEEFQNYLQHYQRLHTPSKDKLITKLIMAGKFDPSYIYIVSTQVLQVLKEVFNNMQKYAQYYVLRDKFIQKLFGHPKYPQIRGLNVRSESNRYVLKQNVQQTLVRMHSQADQYIDIEELLDFFTNRGRPELVQYHVYLANLERQIGLIQQEELIRFQRIQQGGISSSSDQEYAKQIRQRKIKRKKQKIASIRNANNFKAEKKFNVTIPVAYNFDTRKKVVSIRERKVRQMIQEKRAKQDEAMKPIRPKEVPKHVKENLFQRIMKDQQKQRQQRLEKFRLQIQASMVPMTEHLTAPKHITPHCDFSREEYKFVARPMPWYCEVNLLDRINRQKQQRRQRILEVILNRHQDEDLPWGVQQMLQRHEALQEKRQAAKIQAEKGTSTTYSGDLTFMPKITHRVPDFKSIHQHLKIDMEIAKQNRPQVHPQPFSFENRPHKSRTVHEEKKPHQYPMSRSRERPVEDSEINIPVTMKYEALVELRRKQAEQKAKKYEEEQRANEIRKLRKDKFAPYVRSVLRKKDNQLGRSREQVEQKMRDFRRSERTKKQEYEREMINIYTKVFNRPLLVETTGQFGQNQVKKMSRFNNEQQGMQGQRRVEERKVVRAEKVERSRGKRQEFVEDYDERRQRMIDQQPGRYAMEGHYQDDEDRYDEDNFEQDFMSDHGNYTN